MIKVSSLITLLETFNPDAEIKFKKSDSKDFLSLQDISQTIIMANDGGPDPVVIFGVASEKKTRIRKPKTSPLLRSPE